MKRSTAVLALLVLFGAVGVAAALAATVRDRDDVTTPLDIAKASGAHNRASDQLVHTIDFYEPVDPADMVHKDKPPSSVCVEIWTRSTPAESAADYELCASPTAKGKGWKASVARKREVGPNLRIGGAKIEQPSETRIVMRFDPDLIKRPQSYRWRAESTSFARACKATAGCPDYAPDRPATTETPLGKPRS